jgi:GNAT superfamily N-acetyltransferase
VSASQSPAAPHIACRPARAEDTAAIQELTRTIWEGHDYVPQVWAEWLADPYGVLAVAELDGRAAGCGKLSRLSAGEWWLEGLRVDPALEGRGVASRLFEFLLETWELAGDGPIRLVTYRPQVKHLCARLGFTALSEFTIFVAPALGDAAGRFQPLPAGRAEAAFADALARPERLVSTWLMELSWKWASPTLERFTRAVSEGRAWQAGEWLLLTSDADEEIQTLMVQWLACPPGELPAALQDFRRLGGRLGYPQVGWVAALEPALQAELQAAGFRRDWDGAVTMFEKRRPQAMV